MTNIWKYFLTLLIGLIIGFFIGNNNVEIKEVPITIHDTIRIPLERIVAKTHTIHLTDTLIKLDTVLLERDGTYTILPKEFKQYNDTFISDTSKLSLEVKYSGIEANIDEISYVYDYYPSFKCPEEKKIRPFIAFQAGPKLDYQFRTITGAGVELSAGATFKGGNGFVISYELGASKEIDHTFKVGYIKLW